MLELVDEHAEAEAVAEEDDLVLELCAFFAGAREEGDGGGPFDVDEVGGTGEGVEVGDEGGEDFEGAGRGDEGLVEGDDAGCGGGGMVWRGGWCGAASMSKDVSQRTTYRRVKTRRTDL